MEETIRAKDPPQVGDTPVDAAVRYAQERDWEVCPGAWLVEDTGPARCSCGSLSCPRPGGHPISADWAGQASGNPAAVRRMWADRPRASILMPTGHKFDVLDVPEIAGCLALARMERMGIELGPVVNSAERRLQFFVLPGASTKVPGMVRRLGWAPGSLDLVCHGEGGLVLAPPSRVGGHGTALWARPPTALNHWLPEAAELISPLAYACARESAPSRMG